MEAGGTFLAGHRACELVVDDGTVVGVVAESADARSELRARNVLLADGGFQGNPELVAEYITPAYKLRGSPNDTGDALTMGLAVGAVAVNMDAFYGWTLCADAVRDDRLWPYPGPIPLYLGGMLVDGDGRRFVDEGITGELVTQAIARSATPDRCWAICGADVWEGPAAQGDAPINPTLADAGGTVLLADTLEELASLAGLSATAVVDSAMEAAAGGGVGRSGTLPRFDQAPFVAVPVIAGITFAMGGLLVNEYGQVLDASEQPIPGLYAAGGAMGGLQGGPRSGYSGGWSEASTFGLLVAEDVARRAGHSL
jgi:fumarate reductase flavoprotein subunit